MYIEVIAKNQHGLAVGAKVSLSTHAARTMVAEKTGKLISPQEFAKANVNTGGSSKPRNVVSEANMSPSEGVTKEEKESINAETKQEDGTPVATPTVKTKAGNKKTKTK